MSPLELVGDFERIGAELRASRPVASPALRERVAALRPAPPRRPFRRPSGRLVLGLAAAALLASLVAAGLTRAPNKPQAQGFLPQLPPARSVHSAPAHSETAGAATARKSPVFGAFVPAANPARLQRYQATLRLRVKNVDSLSTATKRAQRLARSLGGYVGQVQYSTHDQRGSARIVLRVPVGSVQTAWARLTALGTILQQQTGILDVTRRSDRESNQIAKLERQLAAAGPDEAPAIRAHLRTLQAKHQRLLRSASLARIVLTLTTPGKQTAAAPNRFHRTLDGAGGVLLRELQFLLYALVVAGPLLLIGGAVLATLRVTRRRADNRLLSGRL